MQQRTFGDRRERQGNGEGEHSVAQQIRGGRDNDPAFGSRMRGEGQFSELIARRFKLACQRLGLNSDDRAPLDTSRFRPPRPRKSAGQLELFG